MAARAGRQRDRVVIEPEERRAAVLRVIGAARRRLALTIFRCDDLAVLDAVAAAVERGVTVDVLLTRRARGWRRRLDRLQVKLERLGARVTLHGARATKHHAKYTVADHGPLLVASFNLTRKCFTRTCDFGVLTWDPAAVADAWRLFDADLARRPLAARSASVAPGDRPRIGGAGGEGAAHRRQAPHQDHRPQARRPGREAAAEAQGP